jgi:magnesium-transporting ATPase (P-type)
MLWLNLIMDSLAAIALASEPPSLKVLERQPVNRSQSIISEQMWYNMVGQAIYQVVTMCLMLYVDDWIPGLPTEAESDDDNPFTGEGSKRYTVVFNTFVLMQLFNEYNSRKLFGEINIFGGIAQNPLFIGISLVTMILQVIAAMIGGPALKVHPDGLTGEQMGVCFAFAAGVVPWQYFINGLKILMNMSGAGNMMKFVKVGSAKKVGPKPQLSTSGTLSNMASARQLELSKKQNAW